MPNKSPFVFFRIKVEPAGTSVVKTVPLIVAVSAVEALFTEITGLALGENVNVVSALKVILAALTGAIGETRITLAKNTAKTTIKLFVILFLILIVL